LAHQGSQLKIKMKFLFVGLGGIGQRHLRNLRKILGDDLDIIAYRERNLSQVINNTLSVEEGLNVEEYYGVKIFDSIEKALDEKPIAAFICNPTSKHLKVASIAAEYGCHLFIEKALSDTLDGIEDLFKIVEKNKLTCMVGYQMRFHPCLYNLKKIIDNNELGRIISVSCEVGEYMPGWHKYEDYRNLYAARKDLGGGVVISQIHEFDYIYWLFGFPSKIFTIGGHLSNLEIDVEDVAVTLMECHKDGFLIPIHLHQDYLQQPPSRTCKVIGVKGKAELDFIKLTFTQYDEQGNIKVNLDFKGFDRNQLFIDELEHFVNCLKNQIVPSISLKDGAASLQMALGAKESIESGKFASLQNVFK